MKKLIIGAVFLALAVAAHAQGSFAVNFKGAGNDIRFVDACGISLKGTEGASVEILAGIDINNLLPLGSLALNRTSPAAALGYPNPSAQVFNVPFGANVLVVAYQLFVGADYATTIVKGPLVTKQNGGTGADQMVAVVQAPNLANIVTVGTGSVSPFLS